MVELLSKKEESPFRHLPIREGGTVLFYVSLTVFFFILAGYGGLFLLNRGYNEAEALIRDEIRVKEEGLNPGLINEIFTLENRLGELRALLSGHTLSSRVFLLLEERTHPRVQFTTFNFSRESRKVDLSGVAASYAVLAEQIGLLERHPEMERVEFGGLAQTAQGLIGFKASVVVKESLLHPR